MTLGYLRPCLTKIYNVKNLDSYQLGLGFPFSHFEEVVWPFLY